MSDQKFVTEPAIRTKETVSTVMWDVVLALIPCWIAGIIFFGWAAVWIVLLSTITAVLCEAVILRYHPRNLFGDGSAVVTGMLVGLILPTTVPWWIPVLGSVFAIALVKMAFGGLGHNIFNPAIGARTILLLGFTKHMVKYTVPFDTVTTVTPLLTASSFDWTFVWGNIGGSIGETSVIAILIGAVYLLYRKQIDWRIPVGYVGSAFLVAWLWDMDPWMAITTGGLLFAAAFMATDMVTSPTTPLGRVLFGIGCGIITIFVRKYTSYPEGVSFAVLVMNASVPLIDRYSVPLRFGAVRDKSREQITRTTVAVAVVICLAWGAFALIVNYTPEDVVVVAEGVYLPLEETLGTDAYQVTEMDGKTYYHLGEWASPEKIAFTGEASGYHGPIYFYLVVDSEGVIEYIQVLNHREDPGLGALITKDNFLNQFLGLDADGGMSFGVDIQGITGATVSSRALMRGVNDAVSKFMNAFHAAKTTQQPVWNDGVYTGQADSFGGSLTVGVTISGGMISEVIVTSHHDTPGVSDRAIAVIPERIVAANGIDVDIVSGASVTSDAIIAAVNDGLTQAATGATMTAKGALGAAEKALDGGGSLVPPESESTTEIDLGDGTYHASGRGFSGDLTLAVMIENGVLSAIEVVEHNDTPPIAQMAFDHMFPAIIAAHGPVDATTGATYTANGILTAVVAVLNGEGTLVTSDVSSKSEPIAMTVSDGVFHGSGKGFKGEIKVNVTVANGKIVTIEVVEHNDTPPIAQMAFDQMIPAIVEKQSLVDATTGATFSGEGLLEAVQMAVSGKEAN